jgi:hypothetical protein
MGQKISLQSHVQDFFFFIFYSNNYDSDLISLFPAILFNPLTVVCAKSFQKIVEKLKILGARKFDMKQVPN